MDKIINWVKKNKKLIIKITIIFVVLVLFIVGIYGIISFLMPDTKESVYGDRCEVAEDNPVSKKRESEIKKFLKDYKGMTLIDYNVKCNLIDIIIEVEDETSFSDVKKMGNKLLDVFSEKELKIYDIELMIRSNKKDSEDYPRIGTHHKEINGSMNDEFVW